jgi:XisI protein
MSCLFPPKKSSRQWTHSTIVHLRVFEEKIWLERDETEEGVTQHLLDLGVKKEDIVLAFYHLEDRKLTEFAIA